MASIDFSNYGLVFLVLFFICIIILFRYKKQFSKENIIDYFIYLVNKVLLFILSINSFFIFIVNIELDFNSQVITFINLSFLNIVYFVFITYSVLYGIKFISFAIYFAKESNLFAIEQIDSLKLMSSKSKEVNTK